MTPERRFTDVWPPRPRRLRHTFVAAALLVAAGCGPGGPSSSELAATLAATMPVSIEVGTGGDDPRSTLLGSYNGFAWRLLVGDEDEAAILAWYAKAVESDGWTPTGHGYIWMRDGRSTEHAWRRDDIVLGLGFPDRNHLNQGYAPGTIYELTITYQPEDS